MESEDKALGMEALQPMSLEEFKKSGTLQIMTPDATIAMLKSMQERMPLDHVMMMMPPACPRRASCITPRCSRIR